MSQRWRLYMSHHPCWRQEEQIPSGTPKLVRPWNRTSLFLEDTDFIPCAWQQWLSKPRAERCWVVFELVSRWCKCFWGSCSGGWVSHWWLCWYCSHVVSEGSGCQELAGTLSHCHCLSHTLGSWKTWVVEELILVTALCFWGNSSRINLRFWEGFCLAVGSALAVQVLWNSEGLWSPGLLLDFKQQTCPSASCQKNHLWSHLHEQWMIWRLQQWGAEGRLEVNGWVPLEAEKWDLIRPAEG